MLFLYNLIFPFVLLFFLPAMILKLIRRSGWKKTFPERFAIFSKQRKIEFKTWQGAIWIHAVSVGETNLALSLLNQWLNVDPNQKFILSTTTTTAQEIARNKAGVQIKVIFFPLDFAPFVNHVLNLIHPSMLVILETELWPQLIHSCKKRKIRLFLANTRISDHSFNGYYRFRFIFSRVLSCFDGILAQTNLDKERLLAIAPSIYNKVTVCGNIKFDQIIPPGIGFNYSSIFTNIDNPIVLLAASTHHPEESLILSSYLAVKQSFTNLRLVIVPRHAERGNDIENILKEQNISYHRRSNSNGDLQNFDVLLADTTGELANLIKGADLIIIGKTLAGNNQGQNIIEPALMGKPIICGPQLTNFRQALDILIRNHAVCRLHNDNELTDAIFRLVNNQEERLLLGNNAFNVMLQSRGATSKILNILRCSPPLHNHETIL